MDDAVVFPWVDADGRVTADPVASVLTDTTTLPELEGTEAGEAERRARAERRISDRYRELWQQAAGTAEIDVPANRRLSPHGLRRAIATLLDQRGVPLERIAAVMRHGRPAVTMLYIDRQVATYDIAWLEELFDLGDRPVSAVDAMTALAPFIGAAPSGSGSGDRCDDGRCTIFDRDGVRCSQPAALVHIAGHGYVCRIHVLRSRAGMDLFEPTPVFVGPRSEPDSVVEDEEYGDGPRLPNLDWESGCSAADATGCCGRRTDVWSWVVDGHRMVLCGAHILAFNSGRVDWAGPLRRCEVVRDGVQCRHTDYSSEQLVNMTVDGRRWLVCTTHRARVTLGRHPWNRIGHLATDYVVGDRCRIVDPATGEECGRTSDHTSITTVVIDGVRIDTCLAHYKRWRKGAPRGWNGPIRDRSAALYQVTACQVPDPATGQTCDRDGRLVRIVHPELGEMRACLTHHRRWRKGAKLGWDGPAGRLGSR